jgi:hypothetical protein
VRRKTESIRPLLTVCCRSCYTEMLRLLVRESLLKHSQ